MKLEIQVHSGSKSSDHKFELAKSVGSAQARKESASTAPRVERAEVPERPIGQDVSVRQEVAKPGGSNLSRPASPQKLVQFYSDGKKLTADGEEVAPGVYSILIEGRSYDAQVGKSPGAYAGYLSPYEVAVGLRHYLVEIRDPRRWRRDGRGQATRGPQEIVAPMPGRVVKVLVSEHEDVVQDQGLVVIEAMKMQNEIRAPRAGRVERIYVREDTGVEAGFRLLRFV